MTVMAFPGHAGRSSTLAPWRFASRLASREVRRRPGRTVLVAILVAIPVMAMTMASVVAHTVDTDDNWFWSPIPDGTDIVVSQTFTGHTDVGDLLPASATITSAVSGTVTIESAGGTAVNNVQLSDLAVDGTEIGDGEVWLSTDLAEELGVDAGGALTLVHPKGDWTVVATGPTDADLGDRSIVMPDVPVEQFREGVLAHQSFVELAGNPSEAEVAAVGVSLRTATGTEEIGGRSATWRGETDDDGAPDRASLAWGWVAGALALAATGIIIAAAFATSARRQLVTIGLLSSNGASERLTRRTLGLQGFWTGVVGSAFGLATAVVLLLAGQPIVEQLTDKAISGYRFSAVDLVVIAVTGVSAATIAALVPARTASRVPVMAALAGRRPVGAVPRRLVPTGLALFALGVFLLVVAASSNGGDAPAAAAVIGGVSVLAGVCCCSPLAIDTMSRASAGVGRSWRFAGRSLGRTRTRSAAVVTAIAVTAAVSAAGSAVALKIDDDPNVRMYPADAAVFRASTDWFEGPDGSIDLEPLADWPVGEELRAAISEIVPTATWHNRRVATWDPPPFSFADRGPVFGGLPEMSIVIADDAMVELYELNDADRAALAATGALLLRWGPIPVAGAGTESATEFSVTIPLDDGDVMIPVVPREHLALGQDALASFEQPSSFSGVVGNDQLMITEETARSAGLDVVDNGALLRNGAPLTERQRNEISDAVYSNRDSLASIYVDVPMSSPASYWNVEFEWPSWTVSTLAVQAVLIGAALVLTLLVVAIGLALAATESRDERDVLVAVGARPATMRSMAAAKATVITLTGVALAIPAGLVPTAAVMRSNGASFEMPWLAVGALVVVVPLLAGAAAWLVSSIAQRARPVQMSNLAFD